MIKEEPVSKRCNNTAAQKPFVRALTNGRYKIFCENNKEGIKDIDDCIIIDCVFDAIEWVNNTNLVKFTLNGEYAICRIDEIASL